MKYRIIFKEHYKDNQYVITRNGEVVWGSAGLSVWVGEKIDKLLSWLEFKRVGEWRVIDARCTAPRGVRRTYRTLDKEGD